MHSQSPQHVGHGHDIALNAIGSEDDISGLHLSHLADPHLLEVSHRRQISPGTGCPVGGSTPHTDRCTAMAASVLDQTAGADPLNHQQTPQT